VGATPAAPEDVVKSYLAGDLTLGQNICDH